MEQVQQHIDLRVNSVDVNQGTQVLLRAAIESEAADRSTRERAALNGKCACVRNQPIGRGLAAS